MHPDQVFGAPHTMGRSFYPSSSLSNSRDDYRDETLPVLFSWFDIWLGKKGLPAPEEFVALIFNVAPITLEPQSIIELSLE